MKSSLSKLKRIALHKNFSREKTDFNASMKVDELALAAKDIEEMRNCYDSLLSAAGATANSAYEFSESLQEMAACLLETAKADDDEESGKIMEILGRVQLELQELIDRYRSHIILTIATPTDSLLNDLQTVEDIKRQCDGKRDIYDYMIAQQKENERSKSGKVESITFQQLQSAHDEYEEEVKLCVFRLKSLKKGQSRSLLTQAAHHHAAQLNFFRKGLKLLEAVEPHVRLVTKQHNIDYEFSGLDGDDGKDGYDDGENDYDTHDGRRLSFDYRSSEQGHDVVSMSQNSAKVEESGLSFLQSSMIETTEMSLNKNQGDPSFPSREPEVSSHSVLVIAGKKLDAAEKLRPLLASSAAKSNTYVLPTPVDVKETNISKQSSLAPNNSATGYSHNLWHSSPLDEKKKKDLGEGNFLKPTISRTRSILKENNSDTTSAQLPRPLADRLSLPQVDDFNVSDTKKVSREAFSVSLTSKTLSAKPVLSTSSKGSTELPPIVSGVSSQSPMPQPSSPNASPSLVSPRASELHELPRPPDNQCVKPSKSSQMGHSASLVFRSQERSVTSRFLSVVPSVASPLPTPPSIIPRSFSMPPSSQRAMALHDAKLLDIPQVPERDENAASPLLTPISLSDAKIVPSVSDMASHSGEIQVDAGRS